MTMEIQSNGSKWHGEAPDSIGKLLEVLGKEPLNDFAGIDCAVGRVRFRGNFRTVSHVFCISTDNAETIDTLSRAMGANVARFNWGSYDNVA